MTRCIINADDYGLNEHCSKAIADAFAEGLITDTTMMATGEYFNESVSLAREQGFTDKIGIHFNLTEGIPLSEGLKSCPRFVTDGSFNKRYNRLLPLDHAEKDAIYRELTAQTKKIKNAGIKITHADSHHHIHTAVFIAPIVAQVCKEQGIDMIRLHRNIGSIPGFKMFVKTRYNQWLRKQGFKTTEYFGMLSDIEDIEIPDKCEIMVHPDFDKDGVLIDRLDEENGFAAGNKLPDLRTDRNIELRGYVEI